jgi:hypothetical protein
VQIASSDEVLEITNETSTHVATNHGDKKTEPQHLRPRYEFSPPSRALRFDPGHVLEHLALGPVDARLLSLRAIRHGPSDRRKRRRFHRAGLGLRFRRPSGLRLRRRRAWCGLRHDRRRRWGIHRLIAVRGEPGCRLGRRLGYGLVRGPRRSDGRPTFNCRDYHLRARRLRRELQAVTRRCGATGSREVLFQPVIHGLAAVAARANADQRCCCCRQTSPSVCNLHLASQDAHGR